MNIFWVIVVLSNLFS